MPYATVRRRGYSRTGAASAMCSAAVLAWPGVILLACHLMAALITRPSARGDFILPTNALCSASLPTLILASTGGLLLGAAGMWLSGRRCDLALLGTLFNALFLPLLTLAIWTGHPM